MERIVLQKKLEKLWLLLIVISIFFPLRHVFLNSSAYILGTYSDFTSFSLYASDVLIVAGLAYGVIVYKTKYLKAFSNKYLLALIIWILVSLAINFNTNLQLHLYACGRLLELIVLYGTILTFFRNIKIYKYYYILLILGFGQVLLSFWQFSFQKNLGLTYFGESIIGITQPFVAKIFAEGLIFIRPYGTFPHSNVLSAALVTIFIISFCWHLIIIRIKPGLKYLSFLLVAVFLIGVILTFSRAAYLTTVLTIGLLTTVAYAFKYQSIKKLFLINFTLLILTILTISILNQLIVVRAQVFDDANKERAIYNNIGLDMVKGNPVFGTGIGTSMLHMQQYSTTILQPWQKQPIHNYFLLTAAEIGIPGAILIVLFLFTTIKGLFKGIVKDNAKTEDLTASIDKVGVSIVLLGFLSLMFFDHYFYTIPQAQLLLWTTLGLGAAITNIKNADTDFKNT